jgi:hypothetical protein
VYASFDPPLYFRFPAAESRSTGRFRPSGIGLFFVAEPGVPASSLAPLLRRSKRIISYDDKTTRFVQYNPGMASISFFDERKRTSRFASAPLLLQR